MAAASELQPRPRKGPLIYRQTLATRITHWVWAICLFFLLASGLQIFNAHPALYIGEQSGFEYSNAILTMQAGTLNGERAGITTFWGRQYDTTGLFGLSDQDGQMISRGFPAWATIPSFRDLSTGRVVHLATAWLFVATILIWLIFSVINGRLWREVLPGARDWSRLGQDIGDHLRFRFDHGPKYNVLQKITYSGVLIILFPVMVLTGLAMSPGMDAGWPWLLDVFGGRQTARTIHFVTMVLLVLFFIVHILMVFAAGPINELRSMITGWYRTSPGHGEPEDGQ